LVSLDSSFTRASSRSTSACPLKPWRSCGARTQARCKNDIYFNDDQSECVVLERYRDSGAAIEHAANVGDLFGAILATVSVVHGELLGEPSTELRAKLAGSEVPVLFTPYLSM
jgi:hypothetical protein